MISTIRLRNNLHWFLCLLKQISFPPYHIYFLISFSLHLHWHVPQYFVTILRYYQMTYPELCHRPTLFPKDLTRWMAKSSCIVNEIDNVRLKSYHSPSVVWCCYSMESFLPSSIPTIAHHRFNICFNVTTLSQASLHMKTIPYLEFNFLSFQFDCFDLKINPWAMKYKDYNLMFIQLYFEIY